MKILICPFKILSHLGHALAFPISSSFPVLFTSCDISPFYKLNQKFQRKKDQAVHIGRLDGPELSNWLGLNVVSYMGDDLNLGSGGKREAGMWKHMHRCWEDALTKMWGRGRPQDGSEESGLNHKWMDKPSAEMENKRGRRADFFGLKPEMGSGESRRYSVQKMPFISFYLLISSVFLFVLHCISWEWTPVFSGKKIQLR